MNIIIVGCGKVCSTLAGQLAQEGHNISITDTNNKVIEEFSNSYDTIGITGNGASYGEEAKWLTEKPKTEEVGNDNNENNKTEDVKEEVIKEKRDQCGNCGKYFSKTELKNSIKDYYVINVTTYLRIVKMDSKDYVKGVLNVN